MRYTEFWKRMDTALGSNVARFWADQQVLSELDGQTVTEALDAGTPPKAVWAAVCRALELAPTDR